MTIIRGDPAADKESIAHYNCIVFERGEMDLEQFQKKNRRLNDIQLLAIMHQLMLAVMHIHNMKGDTH